MPNIYDQERLKMNSPNSQATGHQDTEAKINEILKQMTLDEQVLLLSGEDFGRLLRFHI